MKRKFLLIWTSLAVVLSGCGGKDDPAPGPIIPPTPETPDAEKFEVGQVMPAWAEGYMDIHSINGGRGEAFYYIFPDGTTMLVDAAGAPPNELYDYGSDAAGVASKPNVNENSGKVIVNYIKHFAPSVAGGKLDFFVSSHYHGDHIGSWRADYNKFGWTPYDKDGNPVSSINLTSGGFLLNGIAEVGLSIPIVKVLDRGDWKTPPSSEYGTDSGNKRYQLYLNFLDFAKRKQGTVRETIKVGHTDQIVLKHDASKYTSFRVRNVAAGGYVWTGNGSSSTTDFPSADELLKNQSTYNLGENHLSCVLLLQYGNFDMFTGGDVQYNDATKYPWKHVEKKMASVLKKVEVMKASHHSTANTNSK
jgi:beta-lactamase superfamily II metal-dependent hydrolase